MKTVLSEYTNNRDNNFNLIRFIAAFLVLFTHSYVLVTGDPSSEPLKESLGMTWGSIAVDIFFVTSGFLIAGSFFGRKNIIAFVWARILRIYPALIVAMIFCTFIVGIFFTTIQPVDYLTTPETYKYFIKNIILVFGVKHQLPGVFSDIPYKNAVNGSIWTLPNEVKMYFYLAIIGSALVYLQKWQEKNIIKMVFFIIAIIGVFVNVLNYFNLYFPVKFIHLFSMFFAGSAFFLCRDHIYLSSRWFFLICTVLILCTVNKNIFYMVYCISLPYLIFYISYIPSGNIRNFNKIGDYSYGIYIYAFPVQQSIVALVPNVSISVMVVLSSIVTFMLSFFSWHLIEKKCLKMKDGYVIFEKVLFNKA